MAAWPRLSPKFGVKSAFIVVSVGSVKILTAPLTIEAQEPPGRDPASKDKEMQQPKHTTRNSDLNMGNSLALGGGLHPLRPAADQELRITAGEPDQPAEMLGD